VEGGFKRLLKEGFSCDNAMINHVPTYTGVGHATIYTGSVPALHGITGNEWTDQATGASVYCAADKSVETVGGATDDGQMSPRNLLTSTITDELRLATNHRSRVVSVSLKDRGAVLPGGHTANAAYWLEDLTGHFITSNYYMKELPAWVNEFNRAKPADRLVAGEWHTLYPQNSYIQSSRDDAPWEVRFEKAEAPVFPHRISFAHKMKKGVIRETPFGNTLTLEFAKAAIDGHALGSGADTDFLAISLASTDYVGHRFGPNSIEVEDTYLRLDKDLAEFLSYLDGSVGKGNYLVFLTADHGVSHAVGYLQEHRLPAAVWRGKEVVKELNAALEAEFGMSDLILGEKNFLLNLNHKKLSLPGVDEDAVIRAAVRHLQKHPEVILAADMERLGAAAVPEPLKTMMTNGYYPPRCGGIQVIPHPARVPGSSKQSTTHGAWNPYDAHIPVIFMGWGIAPGRTHAPVVMEDIAPTVAALLRIAKPNGCVGQPIPAVLDPAK
jgi:hypothetical protein